MAKKMLIACLMAGFLTLGFSSQASAQNANNDLSPKTQQYIDNLNEVEQAQNANGSSVQSSSGFQVPGFWTIVFYGFLSGATYAFWRWLKKLKNGD